MMNWIVALSLIIFAICTLLIVTNLVSLPKLGDERAIYIKMRAQSYTFVVVIGILLLEIIESIYVTTWTNSHYEGMKPFSLLVTISVIYLISLLLSKRKYGG
ncbi:hypothetical protein SFC57_10530 [Niallia circulans]|jgi:hypothetical protein|nr:hypothetical protein [Niallia circulans]MCM2980072.1 hypothetical protein [Niallia circulans]NRG34860.1 hypothetical protein [Niallia circulans]